MIAGRLFPKYLKKLMRHLFSRFYYTEIFSVMSPGTRGFFLLISMLVVLSGVCLVSISADKRPSREPVPARHGPRKPVRNASKSAAESDVRARGSVTFNKDLESVVIESSAFGDPTSDGQSEPLPPSTPPITIDTVAPPGFPALTTTSRPVTQTTTHHGYGFHYKPGSAVYTIPGNLEDGLTIAAKPVVNGHKSQFSTVVRTQPSALPHDNWGSFKASTVSRVVVAPPSTRIPVAENLVSRDVTSGDNEIASGSGPAVKDPSSSKNPLNPRKEKFPTASGVGEAFENFKSVSKEPQTSASEKQLSSAIENADFVLRQHSKKSG
ncbi:unnamed protein product [Notodromas monacha]|uniref:Uncharacterized protein n=1 Tax=Notodromas monacha TaxID=399045 RepID=A0A7R9BV59_9CRUS|nr:unnamed protein product [Notodromas monacha]CAG0921972.1 unnamed protein product [Notodromas monacha]